MKWQMTSSEVRNKFLEFFASKGHEVVASSSLVPLGDDTLLFANAGMNQFKDFFTGKASAPYKRAVTVQKCVRAGGKHNDLEHIGFTARHHTYFEMLGNFSFGDYFKTEAIEYAWEFLVDVMGISADKLLITVHEKDDEALEIWSNTIGIPKDRIFKKGDKDNFWEMGDFGPCGPCSEIFFDYGKEFTTPGFKKSKKEPFDDGGRFVEIWNLVFMQFEKTPEGQRPLPKPSVDTGMGLERLTALMNGVYFNYETDLFLPLIAEVENLSGKSYKDEKNSAKMRVVADHARSCTMLITDGVIPSNEGRGYVLRRIIRRAVRCLKELGAPPCSFYKLVPKVFDLLGDVYVQNKAAQPLAERFLESEEKKFLETLDQGLKFLQEAIKKDVKKKTLIGSAAFKLYDTYGFPLDLTEIILQERGLNVDIAGFNIAMEERRADSRKSWKGKGAADSKQFHDLKEKHGTSEFVGYEKVEETATLLEIVQADNANLLLFDKTPFYAEGGGQIGDTGVVLSKGKEVATIVDTQAPVEGVYVHYTDGGDALKVGNKYQLKIDSARRSKIVKNHSATHLLHEALVQVLGNHVKQAGSLVADDRLRFDFTHTGTVSKEELRRVEDIVNKEISCGLAVNAEIMSMDQALKKGVKALFGEKYGDRVRVLEMGAFSSELCGGTHVENTSSIGFFSIVSESSLGTGVRRIEAVTSTAALERFNSRSNILGQVEKVLGAKGEEVLGKVESLIAEIKNYKKEISSISDKLHLAESGDLFTGVQELKGAKGSVKFNCSEAPAGADLKKLSDKFISQHKDTIALIYGDKKGKLMVLLRAPKGMPVDCKEILSQALGSLGGRGGGRSDMAQGSCDAASADKLETSVKEVLLKHIS